MWTSLILEEIHPLQIIQTVIVFPDYDPCEEGRSQCQENSACVVDNDSFRCNCNPGFQEYYNGAQITCNDVNECQSGQHECDYNAVCLNNIGSYLCQCNPGFEGNGFVCENARSCDNVTCLENAECVESNGIAECKCMKGFSGEYALIWVKTVIIFGEHVCHLSYLMLYLSLSWFHFR